MKCMGETWGCRSMFLGPAIGLGIQGGFGGVGEVAVEAERRVGGKDGVVVEHCPDEGGFHAVQEVKVLLVRPNRRRLGLRRFHSLAFPSVVDED